MKFKLPGLGTVRTGKDSDTVEIIKEVTTKDKSIGGILDFTLSGQASLSGEKSVSRKLLLANQGWVYRNNDVIAQEVSKMEFELFTIGIKGGEIVYNEVKSHPLLDVLDKPNPETTKNDMLYLTQSHKKLAGDAFWLKIRNGQQVVGFRQIAPDKIELKLRSPTPDEPNVVEAYLYKDVVDGKRVTAIYRPEDVIHFKKPNPNNPFRGIGAVEALAETIDLDNLTTETSKKFFQNGAIMNFILSTESKLGDEQLARLKAEFKAAFSGPQNAFKVPILGGGMEPKDISYSNKEMQFLDQLQWYRDKIMVGFGNTKASLGLVDDVNRASHEGSIIEWQRNTVKPDMQSIVNTLNEFLVPDFGSNLVLGFADPVPEDNTDEIAESRDLYNAGIIMRSEARALLDFDFSSEDDVYKTTPGETDVPSSDKPPEKPDDPDEEPQDEE